MIHIKDVVNKLDIDSDQIYYYGDNFAKIKPSFNYNMNSKLVLLTAINPTKYGEGKTTVAIGLNDAFRSLKINSLLTLREPSMGPVFGIKGGATGGGKSVILPETEINLHFTGDFHAITSANNLICAQIDNIIFHGNELGFDKVVFNRCLDVNDRALRDVIINNDKMYRHEKFNITAASEIMAILCLANSYDDLKSRLDNIIVGYKKDNSEIFLSDLKMTDSVYALLVHAMMPNVVQSGEGNPVIVHGGPFANIAHGCNSFAALATASNMADIVVTEAGFGADMGGFKFLDIVSRENNINPYAVVLIATIRALKLNGNGSLLDGLANLDVHVDNLKLLNTNLIVTINKFIDDSEEDIDLVSKHIKELGYKCVVNEAFNKGGDGCIDLANEILNSEEKNVRYLYNLDDTTVEKINAVIKNINHAKCFVCNDEVMTKINSMDKYKYPICIAKTQYSISHDEKLLGYPKDYELVIKDIEVSNGAKFIKVFLGNIITMPGLASEPALKSVVVDNDNNIILPR